MSFVKYCRAAFEDYFHRIVGLQSTIQIDPDEVVIFPTMLLVTNSSGGFIAELFGATTEFKGLDVFHHKEPSILRYLGQFDGIQRPGAFCLVGGSSGSYDHILIAHACKFADVERRFPHVEYYLTRLITPPEKSLFSFKDDDWKWLLLSNCALVNESDNIVRCKAIFGLVIVNSNITKTELVNALKVRFDDGIGFALRTVQAGEEQAALVGGQLQSLYLKNKLRETTLGSFLDKHPSIFKRALNTKNYVYEPYLYWKEHDGTCTDEAINPDLMICREDGCYDIYDLKTALIDKKSLTVGNRNRRRLLAYVEEGIAQLANYKEYFKYAANAEFAETKYGIKVNAPRCTLVVGSWENCNIDEIKQALRKSPDYEIIDYDTFCHQFIGSIEKK